MRNVQKLFFLFILISMSLACSKNDIKESPIINECEPNDKDSGHNTILLNFNFEIENFKSRSIIKDGFSGGDIIGIFMNDTCKNKPYTYDGKTWNGNGLAINVKTSILHAYIPYNSKVTDYTNIPIDISQQTDIMYDSKNVSLIEPTINFKMKHALSLVRIKVIKNDYTGNVKINSIKISNVALNGQLDMLTGKITSSNIGNITIGGGYTVDDANPVINEFIEIPVESTKNIKFIFDIDGKEHEYQLPIDHQHEAGYINTYTLNLKSGFNCPIDLTDVPYDVEYWEDYGKHDNISTKEIVEDYFAMTPGTTSYGSLVYKNEGTIFSALVKPWLDSDYDGFCKFVLKKDNRIVEQFPEHKINIPATTGFMTIRHCCYVTSIAGEYKLSFLFRRKDESVWIEPEYDTDYTERDFKITVKENYNNIPSLRMLQIETDQYEGKHGYGTYVFEAPDNDRFYISYDLSNKCKKNLKGKIRAVWERSFGDNSNCYRFHNYAKNSTLYTSMEGDDEWEDIIGEVDIDIEENTRFWKGIIPCQLRNIRIHPKKKDNSSQRIFPYNSPMVHLYYQAFGSDEWILLRTDCEPYFDKSLDNIDFETAGNSILLVPQSW